MHAVYLGVLGSVAAAVSALAAVTFAKGRGEGRWTKKKKLQNKLFDVRMHSFCLKSWPVIIIII